jgi:hypothetical protein
MNKLNIFLLFIIFNTNLLHSMKRKPDLALVNSAKKRQKIDLPSTILTSSSTTNSFDNSLELLKFNMNKLSAAIEIYNDAVVQANYITAIQERNVNNLLHWLYHRPRSCHLESIVGLNFIEGTFAVLDHTYPSDLVLNRSLQIAIAKENTLLTDALLAKGAQLIITKDIHPIVQKALNENNALVNLITQYPIDLVDAVNAGLVTVVKAILTKTRPHQLQLNQSLHIAAEQQNLSLATLLIEFGADINLCIN